MLADDALKEQPGDTIKPPANCGYCTAGVADPKAKPVSRAIESCKAGGRSSVKGR